jgi:iron-sulfur cluster assembly protein
MIGRGGSAMTDATATRTIINITEKAQEMARSFLAEEQDRTGKVLRVGVDAGGCSGFSYQVAIDLKKDDDFVQACDGFELVVDPRSAPLLEGTRLDYEDTIGHAGFKFDNPQAQSTCGCGTSFTV